MKVSRSIQFRVVFLMSVFIPVWIPGLAQAVVAPYYAYGDIYTRYGYPDYSDIESVNNAGAGPLYVEGGNKWWCPSDFPSCGVSIEGGDRSAWGAVRLDPATGALGAAAASLAYGSTGNIIYGGYARSYGYISQVFRVGSDGSLQVGDSVSIDASMLLSGTIDSWSSNAQIAGLTMVDYYDPGQKYQDYEGNLLDYMPVSTFEDVLFWDEYLNQQLGFVRYFGDKNSSLVSFQGGTSFDVAVGDLLVMETMIYVSNDLGPREDLSESWSEFRDTLTVDLETTTPGATLNAVPVPASIYLFVSGALFLLTRARKRV